LREFKRSWGEYERQYLPKESEEVLMEILHTQALGQRLEGLWSRLIAWAPLGRILRITSESRG